MSISDPGRSSDRFDSAYRETPPWDVGQPQPALMALLDEYPPTGPVLDVGCSTGELALALAQRGLTALCVDQVEAAIAQARAKAARAAPDVGRLVEFRVGDALHWGEAQAMVGRTVAQPAAIPACPSGTPMPVTAPSG